MQSNLEPASPYKYSDRGLRRPNQSAETLIYLPPRRYAAFVDLESTIALQAIWGYGLEHFNRLWRRKASFSVHVWSAGCKRDRWRGSGDSHRGIAGNYARPTGTLINVSSNAGVLSSRRSGPKILSRTQRVQCAGDADAFPMLRVFSVDSSL